MILLSAALGLKAPEIAPIVRESESTVPRWFTPYQAEGIAGLQDAPRIGRQAKVTAVYREQLLTKVSQRPRALGLEFCLWTLERLWDPLAEQTGIRLRGEGVRQQLKALGMVLSRPQHKISSPDPEDLVKKRRLKINASLYKPMPCFTMPMSVT
jgi:transposase